MKIAGVSRQEPVDYFCSECFASQGDRPAAPYRLIVSERTIYNGSDLPGRQTGNIMISSLALPL